MFLFAVPYPQIKYMYISVNMSENDFFHTHLDLVNAQLQLITSIVIIQSRLLRAYCAVKHLTHMYNYCFRTLSIIQFSFKTQRFGDSILSPSSGKKTHSVGPNR
jgi:hypothetical protein